MPNPPTYASFLVRLWRGGDTDRLATIEDWLGEVEHIQTSQRWRFSTFDELLDLLRQSVEEPEVLPLQADA